MGQRTLSDVASNVERPDNNPNNSADHEIRTNESDVRLPIISCLRASKRHFGPNCIISLEVILLCGIFQCKQNRKAKNENGRKNGFFKFSFDNRWEM